MRAADSAAQVAEEHPTQPPEPVENPAAKQLVFTGILERPQEQRLPALEVVVLQLGELDERLRAAAAGLEPLEQAVCERQSAAHLAGRGQVLDLAERAAARVVLALCGCEPEAVSDELGREIGGAPSARALGSVLEQLGDAGVVSIRGEGKVARPDVRVGSQPGQACVQGATSDRAHAPVNGGADERMREAHLEPLVHDEEPVLDRERKQAVDLVVAQRRAQLLHGGRADRRDYFEQR
jgi:hypothetical protein